MATKNLDTLTADLENQIVVDQLIEMSDIGDHFIFSLLGLASKSNGKWHWIHHLLYPHNRLISKKILITTSFEDSQVYVKKHLLGHV